MAFAFILLFGFGCYGWGRLTSRLFYGQTPLPIAFQVALGLAVLNPVGGVLNATHLAGTLGLRVLSASGIVLAIFHLAKTLQKGGTGQIGKKFAGWLGKDRRVIDFLPDIVALLLTAFFAATLLPTGVFNIHDDFHTYLVRPKRMLATGTVGGNPFDTLGLDSLGTHSLFQGFFLAWRPIHEINGFDAVFCFGFCGLLIGALGRKLKLHPILGLLAVISFASINPQQVNISPIYVGALLITALLVATWIAGEATLAPAENSSSRPWVPVGLLVAGLAGLKLTLAFYAAGFFLLYFFLSGMAHARTPARWRGAAVAGGVGFIATVPWLIICAPALLKARALALLHPGAPGLVAKYPSLSAHDIERLLLVKRLFYGGNQIHYTLIAAVLLCAGAVALHRWFKNRTQPEENILSVLCAATFACAAVYVVNAYLFPIGTAVRYSCPILLGTFPAAALLCCRMFRVDESARLQMGASPLSARLPSLSVAALQLLVVLLFFPLFLNRTEQAFLTGNILSFPIDGDFARCSQASLRSETTTRILETQQKLEPGKTVFAWTAVPFQFDFRRNPVLTASEPGLINPWLRFPAGASPEELANYLRSWGVRYVAFETGGYAIKSIPDLEPLYRYPYAVYHKLADYAIATRGALEELTKTKPIVFQQDHLILLDLDSPNLAASSQNGTLPISHE